MTKITILDGGMGQELIRRSANPPHPLWSAQVLMEEPQIVVDTHRDFLEAGAEIIILNSYSITQRRFKNLGDIAKFREVQEQACALGKQAVDEAEKVTGKRAKIAGCLPPLDASYSPDLAPEFNEGFEEYKEICEIEAPHVDLFIAETLPTAGEGLMAVKAAKPFGKPVWISFTVNDEDGTKLRSGEDLRAAIDAVIAEGADGVLVNCSLPEAISGSLDAIKDVSVPFGAYANGFTAIGALKPGGTVDVLKARTDLAPAAYAAHAAEWIAKGATIVGGCCEVGPAHIAQLAKEFGA